MVASFVATRRRRRTTEARFHALGRSDLVATIEVLHFHDRFFLW